MKGFLKVFQFTFTQKVSGKGYKAGVIVGMLLCFLLPFLIMSGIEFFSDDSSEGQIEEESKWLVEQVYVVDETDGPKVDWNALLPAELGVTIVEQETVELALEQAAEHTKTLLVRFYKKADYQYQVIIPETSELDYEQGYMLESYLWSGLSSIVAKKAELSEEQMGTIFLPIEIEVEVPEQEIIDDGSESEGTEDMPVEMEGVPEEVKMLLGMILSYLTIMIMYFMVLFYGQSVAQSVVLEKSSKLMDTFLVSVTPESMIIGKTIATAVASMVEVLLWMLGLVAGFFGGYVSVKAMNPHSDLMIIRMMEGAKDLQGLISIPGAILGVAVICAGFLLYCSLASIGGAIAGKQEDLSSTNAIFSMVLVVSFLATLMNGAVMGGETPLMITFIPFTTILVTPADLILGNVSVWMGLGILAIVLVTSIVIMMIAGRIYRMLSFYKGNVPNPKQIVMMLRDK